MRNPLCCNCFIRKYERHKRYYNWLCVFLSSWITLALTTENETLNGVKIIISVVLLSEFVSFTRKRSSDPVKFLVVFWISCLYTRKLYEIATLRNLIPSIENTQSCDKIVSDYNELETCFDPCNKLATFLDYTFVVENKANVGNIPVYLTKQVSNLVFNNYHTHILNQYSCEAVGVYVKEYNQGAIYHSMRYIVWGLFLNHLIMWGYYFIQGIASFFVHVIRFLPFATEH